MAMSPLVMTVREGYLDADELSGTDDMDLDASAMDQDQDGERTVKDRRG